MFNLLHHFQGQFVKGIPALCMKFNNIICGKVIILQYVYICPIKKMNNFVYNRKSKQNTEHMYSYNKLCEIT